MNEPQNTSKFVIGINTDSIPAIYKLEHNARLTRKFEKEHTQDVDLIERLINETGKFMTENEEIGLKLYAYR